MNPMIILAVGLAIPGTLALSGCEIKDHIGEIIGWIPLEGMELTTDIECDRSPLDTMPEDYQDKKSRCGAKVSIRVNEMLQEINTTQTRKEFKMWLENGFGIWTMHDKGAMWTVDLPETYHMQWVIVSRLYVPLYEFKHRETGKVFTVGDQSIWPVVALYHFEGLQHATIIGEDSTQVLVSVTESSKYLPISPVSAIRANTLTYIMAPGKQPYTNVVRSTTIDDSEWYPDFDLFKWEQVNGDVFNPRDATTFISTLASEGKISILMSCL